MKDQIEPRGTLSIRIVAMPKDTNATGDIFGGWLVSHMDLAGSCEASRRANCRTVTVAINSMTFIRPVAVGDIVCCYTELAKVGHTSMTISIEVWTLSLKHEQRLKVADGQFVYVAINDQGKPQLVDR